MVGVDSGVLQIYDRVSRSIIYFLTSDFIIAKQKEAIGSIPTKIPPIKIKLEYSVGFDPPNTSKNIPGSQIKLKIITIRKKYQT